MNDETKEGYINIVKSVARLEVEVKNMTKVMDRNGFVKKTDLEDHIKSDRWAFGVILLLLIAIIKGVFWVN